jgi:hypothetical protein
MGCGPSYLSLTREDFLRSTKTILPSNSVEEFYNVLTFTKPSVRPRGTSPHHQTWDNFDDTLVPIVPDALDARAYRIMNSGPFVRSRVVRAAVLAEVIARQDVEAAHSLSFQVSKTFDEWADISKALCSADASRPTYEPFMRAMCQRCSVPGGGCGWLGLCPAPAQARVLVLLMEDNPDTMACDFGRVLVRAVLRGDTAVVTELARGSRATLMTPWMKIVALFAALLVREPTTDIVLALTKAIEDPDHYNATGDLMMDALAMYMLDNRFSCPGDVVLYVLGIEVKARGWRYLVETQLHLIYRIAEHRGLNDVASFIYTEACTDSVRSLQDMYASTRRLNRVEHVLGQLTSVRSPFLRENSRVMTCILELKERPEFEDDDYAVLAFSHLRL